MSADTKIEAAYQRVHEHDRSHPTVPLQVWADVDAGIYWLVAYLNSLPGVRTHASCQGTTEGPHPYSAYVMATWPAELEVQLVRQFKVEFLGEHWGTIHPRDDATVMIPEVRER